MALTAGTLSTTSILDVSDVVATTAPTGGTTPYLYQWYRSTVSGVTISTANILTGATSASLSDSSLTPGTIYYYKVLYTDSNGTPLTVTSAQITVTTVAAIPVQNQLSMVPWLGQLDLKFNFNTLSCQVASTSATIYPGDAVLFTTTAAGVPLVTKSTATSDAICGFAIYNNKDASYAAGAKVEVAMQGNVIYLYAATAVNRGVWVTSLPSGVAGGCSGGVIPVTGSSGLPIAGFALDTGAIGSLIRVMSSSPSIVVDTTPAV